MAIIVVDEAEGVVVIFRGETEGVIKMEVTGGDGGGIDDTGDGTEGGIVVVSRDAIASLEVNQFRNILIAIKGVEEFVASRIRKHKERTSRDGFRWIPNEEIHLRAIVNKPMEFSHAKPLRLFYRC